ncbi:hypothetical protein CDIK_0288 [Cucumispora dikerogammari]|nr:hypothetical protein CDIK_0288 [Cucumispora dikerogammari]
MKEYLALLIFLPITIIILKRYKTNKTHKEEDFNYTEMYDFYNLPENATNKDKRRELLLALAKNYHAEYKTGMKLKRFEQLFSDQIIPKDLLVKARKDRETVSIIKYIIESEAVFCDYDQLDKEARELAKIYTNNDHDIPVKKNLVYLPLDPEKFDLINEMYSKIKHIGGPE